uniref:RING-type domain-containing protein n=1 Tax=Sinocyclocheilus anshuiensis TaxID=1608454 RepID=A0A671QU83_9TELE
LARVGSIMAEAILGDHDQYSCSICLDLLRDPVTIPCGHSYCMGCIGECWNTNDLNGIYRCPQCRQAFNSKPPLNRSTVLAEIMEKLRSTELQHSQFVPGPSSLDSNIKIGDKVRVKPSVVTPTHKWGAITHKSIGVVKSKSTEFHNLH